MTTHEEAATVLAPRERAGFWNRFRRIRPFDAISLAAMLASVVILTYRFTYGLGSVTNLDQAFPWGLWIGFDVMAGVAFAGGAYVLTFMVYVLGMEQYRPIVRVTVLNGFLAYVFYSSALLFDLGRPWNVINPIIGNGFGFTSVLFLVAWHFLLYTIVELIEFSPAIAEWLGRRRLHHILKGMTVAAVVFGITLSSLHQSGLGALFLMAKPKIHPLWYSEFIPILFLVSSVFAGMSMVLFEGSISHRVFHDRLSDTVKRTHDRIVFGLARIAGATMFVYLFLQAFAFVHEQNWNHFQGGWGTWYLTEVVVLTALPMVLFLLGSARRNRPIVLTGSVLALLGVLMNRLNLSIIAFKWYETPHYVPSWQEIVVSAGVISAEIWVFRWIVRRMPVLSDSPGWAESKPAPAASERA